MQVNSTRFGELQVDESAVFTFPMGLLGFGKLRRFIVLDHREDSPFKWLQSLEDPDLAFIITDPLYFKRDYHLSVRRQEVGVIEPTTDEDLIVSVIMTVPTDPQQMSANLLAPLIFNLGNRKAMQYVLTDSRFPVKYFVLKSSPAGFAEPPPGPNENLRSISLR
jgi:flagellar assembly factor FliW